MVSSTNTISILLPPPSAPHQVAVKSMMTGLSPAMACLNWSYEVMVVTPMLSRVLWKRRGVERIVVRGRIERVAAIERNAM